MRLPAVILPELGFLFERDRGYRGVVQWLEKMRFTNATIEPMLNSDLHRVYEISRQYADARFDVVDCCIMAMAERLGITRIATFDIRDFAIFKPRHVEFLELLP